MDSQGRLIRSVATATHSSIPDPSSITVFLAGVSFGIVAPLLYFIIDLPDAIWVGLLFLVDAVARMSGRFLLKRLPLSGRLLISAMGYGILGTAGTGSPLPNSKILTLIYIGIFLVGLATADFPSVASFTRGIGGPLFGFRRSAAAGFVVGCAAAATYAHWVLPSNVLATNDLFIGGSAAAFVSAVAAIYAFVSSAGAGDPMEPQNQFADRSDAISGAPIGGSIALVLVILGAESAFAMGICAAPLMFWESYAFHPGQLALFFAVAGAVGLAVKILSRMSTRTALGFGLLLGAVGFFGFAATLWAWGTRPTGRMLPGLCAIWVSGIVAGLGWGALRSALPMTFQWPIAIDQLSAVVVAMSAVFSSAIWAVHERDSLALPGVIAIATAGWLLLLKIFEKPREPVLSATIR